MTGEIIPFSPRSGAPGDPPQPETPTCAELATTILSLAAQGGNIDALVRAFRGQWSETSARKVNSAASLAHKIIEVLHGKILNSVGGDDGDAA